MAEDIKNVTGKIKQSIGSVYLNTEGDSPDSWSLTYYFQDELVGEDGKRITPPRPNTRMVTRNYNDIKNDVILNGVTVTQIAGLIKAGGYKYRQEDLSK